MKISLPKLPLEEIKHADMHLGEVQRKQPERFSDYLNLNHKDLKGRKILFEFDPATSYEKALLDFITEARNHKEKVIIITPKSSTIYEQLTEMRGIEFIPLTERILSPIFEAHTGKTIALVYDNLSELIMSLGYKNSYGYVRMLLELLHKHDFTALFLFNPDAHSTNETNGIRNLFNDRIAYEKEELTVIKLTRERYTFMSNSS